MVQVVYFFKTSISPLFTQFPKLPILVELYLSYTGKLPLTPIRLIEKVFKLNAIIFISVFKKHIISIIHVCHVRDGGAVLVMWFYISPVMRQNQVFVEPVSSVGRAQVVELMGPRIWPCPGRQRVPHVQLKSEMLRLRGAEVERRASRIYKKKCMRLEKVNAKKKKRKPDLICPPVWSILPPSCQGLPGLCMVSIPKCRVRQLRRYSLLSTLFEIKMF